LWGLAFSLSIIIFRVLLPTIFNGFLAFNFRFFRHFQKSLNNIIKLPISVFGFLATFCFWLLALFLLHSYTFKPYT